jgi:hypothetical protein|tara:strand:+ start:115 stop:549 length:435 start_codon:yes stop_codon:yes gene_type:complete
MAKQLTNKQIETLAKAIVRQVMETANKKASKDPEANKVLKDLEALDKKIAKLSDEKRTVEEKRDKLMSDHNKSSKETRIEREYSYVNHFREETYMVLPQKEFADGVRNSYELKNRLEEEIVLEHMKQDGDTVALQEILVKRFSV